jgi:hypothetical protein
MTDQNVELVRSAGSSVNYEIATYFPRLRTDGSDGDQVQDTSVILTTQIAVFRMV